MVKYFKAQKTDAEALASLLVKKGIISKADLENEKKGKK